MNSQNWLRQRHFEWRQPGRPGDGYVLTGGGERAGTLRFEHWTHESAEGETPFGRWHFRREGFWRPRYLVVVKETGQEVAAYQPRWNATEGTLQTGERRLFRWRVRKFWGGEHKMVDEGGNTVFVLTRGVANSRWTDIFKQQGTVKIEGAVSDGKTMSILMLFAW